MDMTTLMNFFQANSTEIISIIIVIIGIIVFKESKMVKQIVLDAVVSAEANLNSEGGQAKLENVVTVVKQKLPKFVSIFVTRKMIVDIVEESLNFVSTMYDLKHKVDIKGNEEEVVIEEKVETKKDEIV